MKIVDEFTGRIMEGRRWSEGLHQAVEAKEGVAIREEHVTLATITLQNYFRLYEKLAGMTGTAKTEEKEFQEIYNLSVVEVPTNVAVARDDANDYIYKTSEAKYQAAHRRHQGAPRGGPARPRRHDLRRGLRVPLDACSSAQGIKHNVLNAKQHEREAEIIVGAGQPGAVTIATNMAGRGVDIKLGEGVRELGGLYVLGTERHEARRIDNQLRGRSGRQGDPGESRFYLSAQDDLVRLFAGDRIYNIIERFKLPDDQPMEAGDPLEADRERAEEGRGAELRLAEERPQVRRRHERAARWSSTSSAARCSRAPTSRRRSEAGSTTLIARVVYEHTEAEYQEEWDLDSLFTEMEGALRHRGPARTSSTEAALTREELIEEFQDDARDAYAAKEEEYGAELMREVERYLVLQVVDVRWREHLESMEYLRDGIHLRAMAQKDPLVEYRAEGHAMFEELTAIIREEVVRYLLRIQIEQRPEAGAASAARPEAQRRGQRRPRLRARVGCRLGRDQRGRRRSGRGDRRRRGLDGRRRRRGCDNGLDGPARRERVRPRRAQRPVPVRLRQEVQEVPRRVAAVAASPTFTLPARCVTHACAFRR